MKVSTLSLRELNVQRKKDAKMSGKKKVEGIPISVAQAQVQQEVMGALCKGSPKGKV